MVSCALWKASAKDRAEPDAGLDHSGLPPGHPRPGVLAHSDHRAVTLTSSRWWPEVSSLALLPGASWGLSERVAWGAAESFLPGFRGAGAAPGTGVREGVSWQFAAFSPPAAVGPSEHVASGHLPPDWRRCVGWPRAAPALAAEGPTRAPGSHHARRGRAGLFLAP